MLYDNRKSRSHSLFLLCIRLLPFSTSIAIGVPSSTYVCSKNWITELSALRPKATKTFLLPFPSQRHIFLRQEGKITLYLNDRTTGTVPFTLVSQILVKTSRAMTRRHHLHFVAHRSSFIEARALTDFQRSL